MSDLPIREIDEAGVMGNTTLPQSPGEGKSVDYPTCSEPTKTNKGCDAWGRCSTKGQGPYNVTFVNPKGRKTATHCRHWMYKLQGKPGYVAQENPFLECMESVAIDPNDLKKGTRTEHYLLKVNNVKKPDKLNERTRHHINPALLDGPEVQTPSVDAEDAAPQAPVEGIKHGNRRKDNKGDAAGS